MVGGGEGGDGGGVDKKTQAELNKKRQECDKLRNEKEALNIQLEYMKSKVQVSDGKMEGLVLYVIIVLRVVSKFWLLFKC